MKIKLCSLILGLCCSGFALAARAEETNATAPVPQEARRFFVMGVTLFKDAKTPEEFSEAAGKFRQAAELAPQWPEARYNLALAEEAAGDYTAANADLKTYLNFKLPAEEAQKVQDKIYTLEAKAEKAARQRAEEQRLAEAKRAEQDRQQDALSVFVGEWTVKGGGSTLKVRRSSGGVFSMVVRNEEIKRTINCYDISPVENSLSFKQTNNGQETPFIAVVNSRGVLEFRVSLHDDGKFDTVVSEWLK